MTEQNKQKGLEWQEKPLSDNERLKTDSNFLRGTILDDLEDSLTGGFRGDNFQLIRFHGMYEQDDRDIRAERAEEKLEPLKFMLLRCRLPGGIIKPFQWIELDKFAREHSYYRSIRLTNRQTFQYHGVPKSQLQTMHRLLHSLGLDSIATASDMNRNVLCTSNPIESALHQQAYEYAKKISEHLLPRTRGYLDVWIDGKKVQSSDDFLQEEPILGKTYLPRKFKTAVVIPPLNDVDCYGNDLDFVAIADENGNLVGFNVLVGGGLSLEHGNTKTYPHISLELGYVPLEYTLKAAEAVVTTQRDFGNRSDRKNARRRYTIQNMGLDNYTSPYDMIKLLEVLNRLLEKGNTVIIIEHNLDVIKTADYIIDIGVDGGENGGTIVATGTPEEIAKSKKSYTGKYIAKILKKSKK